MSINKFNSQNAPEPVGSYPHARQVGNLLFLSGVGPRERGKKEIPGVNLDENGKIISYDIVAQCHSVFSNVKTILEDSGSDWDKLVDVTVFLTNMKDDFKTSTQKRGLHAFFIDRRKYPTIRGRRRRPRRS